MEHSDVHNLSLEKWFIRSVIKMDLAIFYFYFSPASKSGKGEGREKTFNTGYIFLLLLWSVKEKGKLWFLQWCMTLEEKERLSPFGKNWSAHVVIVLMAFDNDFTAQIVTRLLQCKWDTSEIFCLKTPTTDHWYHWKFFYLIDFGSLSMLITMQTTYYLVAFILYQD